MIDEDLLKQLEEVTFSIHHNPNCPSPYLCRLIGIDRPTIDYLPPGESKDIMGYGKRMIEATKNALGAKEVAKRLKEKRRKEK